LFAWPELVYEAKRPRSWRHSGKGGAGGVDGRSEQGQGFILLAHTLSMETPAGRGARRLTKTAATTRTRSWAPQKGAAIAAKNLIVDLQEGGVPFLYPPLVRTSWESEGGGPRWRRRERGSELASRRRKEGGEEKRHTPTTTESSSWVPGTLSLTRRNGLPPA
jgi:hypothetical protein